jgi:hypothetical protein
MTQKEFFLNFKTYKNIKRKNQGDDYGRIKTYTNFLNAGKLMGKW